MSRIGILQIIIVNTSFSSDENNCLANLSPISKTRDSISAKRLRPALKHGYFTKEPGSDERKEKTEMKYKENALSLPTHSN